LFGEFKPTGGAFFHFIVLPTSGGSDPGFRNGRKEGAFVDGEDFWYSRQPSDD